MPKRRGQLIVPNNWTNTAQKAFPENVVWDPDTSQYVLAYMAQQETPSAFSLCCYATAPTLAAIKAGQLTVGGIVRGMTGADSPETPHLVRDGETWYSLGQPANGSNIDIWSCSTSPAGAGTFAKVQTSIVTKGAVAQISTPAAPTVAATTGAPGTLPAATYNYKVSALTTAGETTAGNAGSATLASTGFNTVTLPTVTGETNGFNIYRQITPGTLYMLVGSVAHGVATYQDNGTSLSNVQSPLQNLSASFDSAFALEQYVIRIPTSDPLWAQGYRWAMYYMGQPTAGNTEQIGVQVSATLNAAAASWTKLNGGNPLIGAGGGFTNDADGAADPFVWIAPNGNIIVFYVAIEAGGIAKTMHWHYAAAYATQVSGPYTKLGTVIDSPCYPDVGKNGSATWAGSPYSRMAQMNGDEGGVWRGSFIRNDVDGEVLWVHAGKNRTGVSDNSTTVAGFVDTFYLDSKLLQGIFATNPWEHVEIESGDPRWVLSGTWTSQSTTEWSGGSMKFSTTTGNTATFYFEGTAARMAFGAENNCGIVEIYIDGTYVRTLDLYNPASGFHSPVLFDTLSAGITLTPGHHSVQAKVVGKNAASSNSVCVVDYAEVLGTGVGL